jgi:hypothetical protein
MPTTYAIPNGRTVFDATLFTGTGSSGLVVSNADLGSTGFYPDLIWIKSRNAAYYNTLLDYPRGASVRLFSNLSDAESNNGCQSSFNTNGFTLNADSGGVNNSGTTYVAWQWNAGSGTTSTNNVGSISSTVDVNQTAGFSIVTYTGNGVASTIGHGLGVAPSMMIVKCRSNNERWDVYHSSIGATGRLILNDSVATETTSAPWNNTAPTSSVFTVGTATETNRSAAPMVAYCWAQIAGFSAFGSYVGNGSTDGPFVYTGFRPVFIMTKNITTGGYWWEMVDAARSPYNTSNKTLYANVSDAEYTSSTYDKDLLSNGFKMRGNSAGQNSSGDTFIYMAFAENPFKYANAR